MAKITARVREKIKARARSQGLQPQKKYTHMNSQPKTLHEIAMIAEGKIQESKFPDELRMSLVTFLMRDLQESGVGRERALNISTAIFRCSFDIVDLADNENISDDELEDIHAITQEIFAPHPK